MDYSALMVFTGFLGTLILGIISSVLGIISWLSKRFHEITSKIDETRDLILQKLEYHEKHDDERFASMGERFSGIKDDIWEIRLRTATKDNLVPITKKILHAEKNNED